MDDSKRLLLEGRLIAMAILILASASPRRAQLLRQIDVNFEVVVSNYQEQNNLDLSPEDMTVHFARGKARETASRVDKGLVLGADTAVVLKGEILGKPGSPGEAVSTLKKLEGKCHRVITGISLVDKETGKEDSSYTETKVWFREIGKEEIKAYVDTGEALDKAGSYGIQGKGALFVEKIEGCYFNVVGLPLAQLAKILGSFDFKIW